MNAYCTYIPTYLPTYLPSTYLSTYRQTDRQIDTDRQKDKYSRIVCIVINYKSVSSLDQNDCKFYLAPAFEVFFSPFLRINTYFAYQGYLFEFDSGSQHLLQIDGHWNMRIIRSKMYLGQL